MPWFPLTSVAISDVEYLRTIYPDLEVLDLKLSAFLARSLRSYLRFPAPLLAKDDCISQSNSAELDKRSGRGAARSEEGLTSHVTPKRASLSVLKL